MRFLILRKTSLFLILLVLSLPSLSGNVAFVSPVESNEETQAFAGYLRNPYGDVAIADIVLRIYFYSPPADVTEENGGNPYDPEFLLFSEDFPLADIVLPKNSLPFFLVSRVPEDTPYSYYQVDYARYTIRALSQTPKWKVEQLVKVKGAQLDMNTYRSSFLNDSFYEASSATASLLFYFFTDGGVQALKYYVEVQYDEKVKPFERKEFLIKIPKRFQLGKYYELIVTGRVDLKRLFGSKILDSYDVDQL